MEPVEVFIGDEKVLVEIDDLDSASWKGTVIEGPPLEEGEVTVRLVEDGKERTSRALVVSSTGPYQPAVLEGVEAFRS